MSDNIKLDENGVLDDEAKYLQVNEKHELWALCLSGGGIRSATFSLGVIQGLAKRGLLDKFHYLSTVSGGGYIGSWLSSWIAREQGGLDTVKNELAGKQPQLTDKETNKAEEIKRGSTYKLKYEPQQVSRLRAYSNYLSPVWGLSTDFFTLISIFLRNLFLNWLVLGPLFLAALVLPRFYLGILAFKGYSVMYQQVLLGLSAVLVGIGIAYAVSDLPGKVRDGKMPTNHFPKFCFLPIMCASVLLSWLGILSSDWIIKEKIGIGWFIIIGALLHLAGYIAGLAIRKERSIVLFTIQNKNDDLGDLLDIFFLLAIGAVGGGIVYYLAICISKHLESFENRELYATFVVPVLVLCFWFATTLYVGFTSKKSTENDREWWARAGAWWLRAILGWILVFTVVIYGPQWIFHIPGLSNSLPTALTGGGILGILTGLLGYWSKNGAMLKQRAQGIAVATGMRLLDLAAIVCTLILLIALCFVLSWSLDRFDPFYKVQLSTVEPKFKSQIGANTPSVTTANINPALKPSIALAANEVVSAARATEGAAKSTEAIIHSINAVSEAQPKQKAALVNATNAMTSASKAMEIAAENMFVTVTNQSSETYVHSLKQDDPWLLFVALLVLAGIGTLMSLLIEVNTFSLHSMYGNRLVRAYLGAIRKKRHPHWFTGFDPNDNIKMVELKAKNNGQSPPKLFHVINIALNIARPSGGRLEWQQRKAEPFTVSPLHSGNPNVGYVPSATYSSKHDGISLGRAMTISGAAASPNMGYQTSFIVAFVMTFFNIRLGWWLPNPKKGENEKLLRKDSPTLGLLYEAFAQTTDESSFVYLSDGGHFENLGLYEMVRRRCHKIMVVDASCDPEFKFEDLEDAIRKIRIDFGVLIEFEEDELPSIEHTQGSRYHYAIGKICYPAKDKEAQFEGKICYIKPVLTGDEPLDVTRYSAKNKGFPHQSTADQFFDESQFESYRMLGQHSMENMDTDEEGWPRKPWNATRHPSRPRKITAAEPEKQSCECTSKGNGGTGLISSISNAAQSMGQGAILASAITVGGVLGVSGTVALTNSTVTLQPGAEVAIRPSDIETLKQGIPIKPESIQFDANLMEVINNLKDSINNLRDAIKLHPNPNSDPAHVIVTVDPSLVQNIDELLRIVKQYTAKINATITTQDGEIAANLRNIAANLDKIREEIAKNKIGSEPLAEKLDKVIEQLGNINDQILIINPRRNIRGAEGGAK